MAGGGWRGVRVGEASHPGPEDEDGLHPAQPRYDPLGIFFYEQRGVTVINYFSAQADHRGAVVPRTGARRGRCAWFADGG